MIETEVYKIGAGHYGRRVAAKLASRWWLPLGLPIAALLVAGAWDWRWWIVGLAVILVIYPGLLMLAYYYYALSPEAVRAILPQKAVFDENDMTIVYYPMAEGCNAPSPRSIPREEILGITIDGDYLNLILPKEETLEIPRSAFQSGEIYEAFPELRQG